jgi:hypothetical protein
MFTLPSHPAPDILGVRDWFQVTQPATAPVQTRTAALASAGLHGPRVTQMVDFHAERDRPKGQHPDGCVGSVATPIHREEAIATAIQLRPRPAAVPEQLLPTLGRITPSGAVVGREPVHQALRRPLLHAQHCRRKGALIDMGRAATPEQFVRPNARSGEPDFQIAFHRVSRGSVTAAPECIFMQ